MENQQIPKRPAGYDFLTRRYGLPSLPHWNSSSVKTVDGPLFRAEAGGNGRTETVYPRSYWPGDGMADHLAFALKYDGVNLGILSALFENLPADDLTAWIASRPTGKYQRKAWFLYEFLAGRELPLPDLGRGNYIDVLDPGDFFAAAPGRRVRRQRVMDNLLGGRDFCPVVRRADKIVAMDDANLLNLCSKVKDSAPPRLMGRAVDFLYAEETKSSFGIEGVRPDNTRTARFVGMLREAEKKDFCAKPLLIEAQNRIVEDRFRNDDYRKVQVYIGQTMSLQREHVHYVCPKPDDVPALMDGLLAAHKVMEEGGVPAVVHAAVISYGFVFLHPFLDGNGRIHRFLIHNILSTRGALPKGFMIPVSASMLKRRGSYDRSLEAFSAPLMSLVEFDLDDQGGMTVEGDTANLYRYADFTVQAEALCDFVRLSVEDELVSEVAFLEKYDRAKPIIQEIVDMPDHLVDLFIKLCLQNRGRLSATKRKSRFGFLTDGELAALEGAVRAGFSLG